MDGANEELLGGIVDNLARLYDSGWQPPQPYADPIAWQKREHNLVADWLCNYTMDCKRSWETTFKNEHLEDGMGFNLLMHSDGGSRATSAAAAWIVKTMRYDPVNKQCVTLPLAMAGSYFDSKLSSFEVESIALRFCTNFACELLAYSL